MYAYNNDTFKQIFETKEYEFKDKSLTVESSLVHYAKRVNLDTSMILGAKTGYEEDAGRCLASIAYDKKNDIYYLLVTTKADDDTSVMYNIKDAVNIYNYFFNNYSYHDLVKKNDKLVTIKTKYLKDDEITFKSAKQVKLYYNNNNFDTKNIKIAYAGIKEIKPFTKKGSTIGTVSVYYKDKLIDKIDIKLTNKPKLDIKKVILDNYFTIICILFFIFDVVLFYFTIKRYINIKRKKI
jgi:serine-type D-Ala-D-Ala carboxypeptidase (penicillin-binding protein 5/6)